MSETLLNSLFIAGFTVMLGALMAFFARVNTQRKDEIKELQKAVTALQNGMATVNTQMSPLWARVQAQIAQDLHHPHVRYLVMDKLLESLEALTITSEERGQLKTLLIERSRDMHEDISQEQREKAAFMVTVMDMVLAEKAVADAADSAVARIATIEGAKETLMEIHIPLPPGSKFNIPFLGAFLTRAAMDSIHLHRKDLFLQASDYYVIELVAGKLWFAGKKWWR